MFGLDFLQAFVRMAPLYHQRLRVYPILKKDSQDEYGDKIILPEIAMAYISNTTAQYPLMFRITNGHQSSYCGVKEFSAPDRVCYLPRWIMAKFHFSPGDFMIVENLNLRKATFVKLKFRDGTFGELSNPRAILEIKLKNFSVLSKGDSITIEHLGKEYIIDIIDTKPDDVVVIVETDVEVDIEYAEVEKIIPATPEEPEMVETSPHIITHEESVSPNPDSLNKFKSKKNYFQGEAHSLRSSENSIRSSGSSLRSSADTLQKSNSSLRSSGFSLRSSSSTQSSTTAGGLRRSDQGLRQSASENRFEEIDKENRFKGVGHKLK